MAKSSGDAAKKEAKAAAKAARKQASKERRKQMWQAFQMQRREDKKLIPIMLGILLGAVVVAFLIGWAFNLQWLFLPLGIAVGILGAVAIFGRRVQSNVYRKAEGQRGAAGWALENLQGSWRVTNAVAGTTHLDAVHRVIGRPGVILVAEGAPHRLKGLVAQEKKRIARLIGDTPIYDLTVGNEEGQVPLSQLQKYLRRLPKNIDTKTMDTIESRLSAMSAKTGPAMPKGPIPGGAKMRGVQRTVRRR